MNAEGAKALSGAPAKSWKLYMTAALELKRKPRQCRSSFATKLLPASNARLPKGHDANLRNIRLLPGPPSSLSASSAHVSPFDKADHLLQPRAFPGQRSIAISQRAAKSGAVLQLGLEPQKTSKPLSLNRIKTAKPS